MDALEEIRQRKLEQLQQAQKDQMLDSQREHAEFQQKVDMLEQFVKSRLTKDALMRYSNIKIADPDKAIQLLAILGQMFQTHKGTVDDGQLREILLTITPARRETKITRK